MRAQGRLFTSSQDSKQAHGADGTTRTMMTSKTGKRLGSLLFTKTTFVVLLSAWISVTYGFSPLSTTTASSGLLIWKASSRIPTTTTESTIEQQQQQQQHQNCWPRPRRGVPKPLYSFMGSDGGILGVGTPELVTIILVGYFLLGPSELYKIVKEIGKFIQNIRTLGTDLSTTFENNMESQLQLQELRKAQAELADAFSFRRSINTNQATSFSSGSSATTTTATTTSAAGAGTASVVSGPNDDNVDLNSMKRKKIRRRIKKRLEPAMDADASGMMLMNEDDDDNDNNDFTAVPDLTMPGTSRTTTSSSLGSVNSNDYYTPEEEALIDAEFDKYTNVDGSTSSSSITTRNRSPTASSWPSNPDESVAARNRFQQQLNDGWNQQILANEDNLSPLVTVMNKIALLEQEKRAATARLEEEFQKRAEMDQAYFREQRQLLDEAGRQIQESALGLSSPAPASSSSSTAVSSTTTNTIKETSSTPAASSSSNANATR